jgi:LemA protein
MIPLIVVLVLIGIAVAWIVAMYNGLVRLKNLVEEGWSGIDVQLKRRADLIPNLIETVKGYMTHERELLEKVTELRSKAMKTENIGEKAKIEGELSRSLMNVLAVAEGYPDLKANQNFLDLQDKLTKIEDEIQMARRYYNGTARNLNIKVESFPSNIIANMFHFKKADYFEIEDEADRKVPEVKF